MAKRKPNKNRPRKSSRGGNDGTQLLYGVHACLAALANPDRVCHRLMVADPAPDMVNAIKAAVEQSGVDKPAIEVVDRLALVEMLPNDAVHQGIALRVAPLEEYHLDDIIKRKGDCVIVFLDQATDPRNVGAVLRSAAAFGADALVMQDRHAPQATGALAKAASGALERVPVIHTVNLARGLVEAKQQGYWCIGLAGEADMPIQKAPLTGRVALVLGAEGSGLRRLTRETCDVLAYIPMTDSVESLNLSNAAAVALYEAARQRD